MTDPNFLAYLIDQKRLRQRITDDPAEVRRIEIEVTEAQRRLNNELRG
jgi:hypothetical protein